MVVWFLLERRFAVALALVLFAGLTDWLDGFAARRLRVSGKLGAVLDPLADKTFLVTVFLTLGVIGLVPFWVLVLVIARDVVIITGAALLRMLRGIRKFPPTMHGKISTFFQIVFVLLVLIEAAVPNTFLLVLRQIALGCTAVFTSISGFDYVRIGLVMTKATAGAKSV